MRLMFFDWPNSYDILVEAKTQLGFRYASISTKLSCRLVFFVVSNNNSWVLASTIA
jgi:hypothetical protein